MMPLGKVFTKADIELAASYLQTTADELSRVTDVARLLGSPANSDESVALLRLRALRILSLRNSDLIVDRHRRDETLRTFAIQIDTTLRLLYGSSLYGTAAHIANVALNRKDLTGLKIREILRGKKDKTRLQETPETLVTDKK